MEPTIEEIMQKGIEAQRAGNLGEAARLYQSILNFEVNHPDANHNLGVIAVAVDKVEVAIPLLKTAVESNPTNEQYWYSYINALIQGQKFKVAGQVLKYAKNQGLANQSLEALNSKLNSKTDRNINFEDPPQELIDKLLEYYRVGRHSDAEKLAVSMTREFPEHQFGWKVLGALLMQAGRINDSLVASQQSAQLVPQDAEAQSNLGNVLKEIGRIEEAKIKFTQAIALKPDFAEAHYNLGNAFKQQSNLVAATECYRVAIKYKSDFAEAYDNLGVTLQTLGQSYEAAVCCNQAIKLRPDLTDAYVNLGIAIKNLRFKASDRKFYPALIQLLTKKNSLRPRDLAPSIISLLKHDPLIKDFLLKQNVVKNVTDTTWIIKRLDRLTLLHQLMRVCPLPDPQFELVFKTIRSSLLYNLGEMEKSPELINFLSTLALHCSTNEYIYGSSHTEIQLVTKLEKEIAQTISRSEQPEVVKVFCLATYRRLCQFSWCEKLNVLDPFTDIKSRLITEPLVERTIAKEIATFGEISNSVSTMVRAQYETNPYPRWIKPGTLGNAKQIGEICDEISLRLQSENIKQVDAPAILIAGCGTGQHSIGTAIRFANCHVTALDLSLASLAYAKRKTAELKITNIEYFQADILNLDSLEQKFDIIETTGVLHHMDIPIAGWEVLTKLLKPGGLMKVALYSDLARQNIVKIREEISALGIGTSDSDIISFRETILESNEQIHRPLMTSSDFFSLSALRDLLFHVREHRFTLSEIEHCLDQLRLTFCGFENKDAIRNFKGFHGSEADIYDLGMWNQYEEANPLAFAGMYQFWCQKVQ